MTEAPGPLQGLHLLLHLQQLGLQAGEGGGEGSEERHHLEGREWRGGTFISSNSFASSPSFLNWFMLRTPWSSATELCPGLNRVSEEAKGGRPASTPWTGRVGVAG